MSDIKGISPSFWTHKILIEESFKLVIQPQRRLNPKVQDVVKDEIVRLLDSGLIYPISDSPWEDDVRIMQRSDNFQRCMTAIFHDMVEDFIEVFMDDFSVFSNSFDQCLNNLDKMLGRCEETNLVLNWEKCHFMVNEVGAVLGQRIDGKFKPIYYSSKTLNDAQAHYTTTEKELLAVMGSASSRIQYRDKKGAKNLVADHLSRLENPNIGELAKEEIEDKFPDEHLMILKAKLNDEGLWCVAGCEILEILDHYHSGPTGGHHSASVTGRKVYEVGFNWPNIFKDAKDYVMKCNACRKSGNISSRNEMPQNNIQVCEVFDIWGQDFMGPFPDSR
ncbi:reverse transcriptase domain-containing protein, partial [Tanacetum coccineum]